MWHFILILLLQSQPPDLSQDMILGDVLLSISGGLPYTLIPIQIGSYSVFYISEIISLDQ